MKAHKSTLQVLDVYEQDERCPSSRAQTYLAQLQALKQMPHLRHVNLPCPSLLEDVNESDENLNITLIPAEVWNEYDYPEHDLPLRRQINTAMAYYLQVGAGTDVEAAWDSYNHALAGPHCCMYDAAKDHDPAKGRFVYDDTSCPSTPEVEQDLDLEELLNELDLEDDA